MIPFIKHSILLLLLACIVSCKDTEGFDKVELLKNINIKNHQVALLEINHYNNSKWLLARDNGIQILKSLQTYVLHKQTSSRNYSIQLLIDGKIEKELFFSNKPRWFTAHEVPSKPFEETPIDRWMFLPVVSSSNSTHAIYSRKDNENFAYKEPHFINKFQEQTKQIKAEYFNNTILWDKVHYLVKPSAISKELIKAYQHVQPNSTAVMPLNVNVKIDKGSMEILEWTTLGNLTRVRIIAELNSTFKEGDIIFQISKSSQSKAIQLATNSLYSHMGIIYKKDNEFFVYEAVQPVKFTPLQKWIKRGDKGHYVVKRLKHANILLTNEALSKMKQVGRKYNRKDYDMSFEWSDTKIYCSELVWKIYNEALGLKIGKLSKLSDFNLSDSIVKAKLKERYGTNIPLNEPVIAPAAMFNSDKLITIVSN